MKWHRVLPLGGKKQRMRHRRARHVLAAKMSGKQSAKEFSRRVGAILLLAGSLATAALVTSIGMDAILGALLYRNSDFTLRRFVIEPANKIGKGELVAASGVKIGQNLLQMSLDEVRGSIEKIPHVASVRVERHLPDTLYLFVEERRPVALLAPTPTAGMQLAQPMYYIDSRGFVLKPKPGEKLMALPVIRGISSDEVVEGEISTYPDLKAALLFLREASMTTVRDGLDCSKVLLEGPGRFVVSTPKGGKIRFRTSYLSEQFERLNVIFEYAENKGRTVQTVDLTPERNVPVTFLN
jgi:cell division protein FtsQ